jgi:hypothetical protein
MNLKKNSKVFTSKFVGTGTSSYEKRIYRAAVSQRLRNTAPDLVWSSFLREFNSDMLLLSPAKLIPQTAD